MSTLLEEAIADAAKIKEAARKAAEADLLNSVSTRLDEAVSKLFEQDEELELPSDEELALPMPGEEEVGLEPPTEIEDIPLGSTEKDDSGCECEDDEVVDIVIDFDEIEDALGDEGLPGEAELVDAGQLAAELPGEELPGEEELPALEEQFEISDDLIDQLREEYKIDVDPENEVMDGKLGRNDYDWETFQMLRKAKENDDQDEDDEQLIVRRKPTDKTKAAKTSNIEETVKSVVEQLQEKFLSEIKHLKKEVTKYREEANRLKSLVEATNLDNYKLIYMNRALRSSSLNGQQLSKFAKGLAKAESINEVKKHYDYLQSVASTSKNTLNEVLNRKQISVPSQKRSPKMDPEMERWQKIIKG